MTLTLTVVPLLPPLSSDSYIVRVKAVVMTRDDSSGGWLAQDGGALCRVGVCRVFPQELSPALPLPPSPASRNHFLIHGERDKQVSEGDRLKASTEDILEPHHPNKQTD